MGRDAEESTQRALPFYVGFKNRSGICFTLEFSSGATGKH